MDHIPHVTSWHKAWHWSLTFCQCVCVCASVFFGCFFSQKDARTGEVSWNPFQHQGAVSYIATIEAPLPEPNEVLEFQYPNAPRPSLFLAHFARASQKALQPSTPPRSWKVWDPRPTRRPPDPRVPHHWECSSCGRAWIINWHRIGSHATSPLTCRSWSAVPLWTPRKSVLLKGNGEIVCFSSLWLCGVWSQVMYHGAYQRQVQEFVAKQKESLNPQHLNCFQLHQRPSPLPIPPWVLLLWDTTCYLFTCQQYRSPLVLRQIHICEASL